MNETDSLHFLTAVEADDQGWIDSAKRRKNWSAIEQIAQDFLAGDDELEDE